MQMLKNWNPEQIPEKEDAVVLSDVKGNVTLSVLYQFQETGVVDGKITGKLEAVHSLKNCEKLKSAGIVLSS